MILSGKKCRAFFEHALKLTDGIAEHACDGVYEDRPGSLFMFFHDRAYNLSRLRGVPLNPERMILDESLRVSKLLEDEQPSSNLNDGLYREQPKGPVVYAVVGGRTYTLKSRPSPE